ncbi:Virulence protein SrfB [Enterobacter cancerogenus]|uniref:Virulence protein SrfB n=1 Tax=Enterobacter cancerogenus TaxID=69218 RepID=A0A484Z9U5_9ENTR|nr:Virulence protein SrfB [Enterobacter cancerogenus]
MLANLCDYKQSVTLIANSGVQFLDFGLTPQDTASTGRFVRKTANGPLLRLDYDLVNGRLHASGDGRRAARSPEARRAPLRCTSPLLCWTGVWLPLPFLRFNPPRTFVEGPDNWARVQIRKLTAPDSGRQYAPRHPWRSTARLRSMPPPHSPPLKTIF